MACRNCWVASKLQMVVDDNVIAMQQENLFDISYWEGENSCGTTRCLWGNHLFIRYGKVFRDKCIIVRFPSDYQITSKEKDMLFIEPIEGVPDNEIEPYLDRIRDYITVLKGRCTCVEMS